MIRIFRHYVPRLTLALAFLEIAIFIAAVHLGVAVRFQGVGVLAPQMIWLTAVMFAGVMVITLHAMGLYRRETREDYWDSVFRLGAGFLLGLSVTTLIFYALPGLYIGRGAFGLTFGIAFLISLMVRALFHKVAGSERFKRRLLVIGSSASADQLVALSKAAPHSNFRVALLVRPAKSMSQVASGATTEAGVPVQDLESIADLFQEVVRLNVEEIVIAADMEADQMPMDGMLACKLRGIPVTQLMTFYERETGQIRLDAISRNGMAFSDGFRRSTLQAYLKRLFDLSASAGLLLVAWPAMLLTALALLVESKFRDPVFYRQVRVGEFGKNFDVVKFRSMTTDAEQDGQAQWAQQNDPRVTKVGAFIRNTRIDELPQLINVFKGEMSFVGPRPERPVFVKELAEEIDHFELRQLIKPGITGWAQICYPYGASVEDSRQKLQYDLYYIKNQTIFLDLAIVLQTVYVILWGQGSR